MSKKSHEENILSHYQLCFRFVLSSTTHYIILLLTVVLGYAVWPVGGTSDRSLMTHSHPMGGKGLRKVIEEMESRYFHDVNSHISTITLFGLYIPAGRIRHMLSLL